MQQMQSKNTKIYDQVILSQIATNAMEKLERKNNEEDLNPKLPLREK
jgi:hypothetical protein